MSTPTVETVRVGNARMPYKSIPPTEFIVYAGGREVGAMWRYGRGTGLRYRAYRNGHGSTFDSYPSQVEAAAAVGWRITVAAWQLQLHHLLAAGRRPVRLADGDGQILTVVQASNHDGARSNFDYTPGGGSTSLLVATTPAGGTVAIAMPAGHPLILHP